MNSNWTNKQIAFCDEYLIDNNQTQAAIRAGYSEKTAAAISNQLMNQPKILNRIKKLQDERAERTRIDADLVLKEHYKRAFYNIWQVIDHEKLMKDKKVIIRADADGTMIHEIGQMKDGGIRIKLVDKDKNLEMIGRHLGMYTDKFKIEDDNPITDMLKKLSGLPDDDLINLVKKLSEN